MENESPFSHSVPRIMCDQPHPSVGRDHRFRHVNGGDNGNIRAGEVDPGEKTLLMGRIEDRTGPVVDPISHAPSTIVSGPGIVCLRIVLLAEGFLKGVESWSEAVVVECVEGIMVPFC